MSRPTSYLNGRVGYEAYAEALEGTDIAAPPWDNLVPDAQQAWERAAAAIAETAEARAREERSAPYGRCGFTHCHKALVEIGMLDGVPAYACPDRADPEHQTPPPAGGVRLTAPELPPA